MEILSRSISTTVDGVKMTDLNKLFRLQFIHFCGLVIAYSLVQGGVTQAVAEIYLNMKPCSLACLKTGASRFGSMLCADLLGYGLLFALFLIIGILGVFAAAFLEVSPLLFVLTLMAISTVVVFGLYRLMVMYAIVYPSIIIEKKSPIGGIRRAFELADGRLLEMSAPLFTYYLFVTLMVMVFWVILGWDTETIYSAKGIIVTAIPDIVLLPFMSTLHAVIYFNLRVSKEGMDATVLARDILPKSAGVAYKRAHVNDGEATETSMTENEDELV
jgi:hypothetical protein